MKISAVETFLVAPRWLFVKISTNEGVSGWGEATLEGRSSTVRTAIHEFDDYLVGADPLPIERHWQVLTKSTFYRGGPVFGSAVAGIDQALWDIAGKYWISSSKAIDGVLARAAAVRDALGDEADFALDFHGRFSTATARRVIDELAVLRPMFVEEPVLPEHTHRLRDVVEATTVPIACGERMYGRSDFLPALQAGIGVAQPDVSHCGGISEARRIASLVDTFDVLFAPHCPLGPIALAASMQVSLATPNFLIQEQSLGIHYNEGSDLLDYLVDPSIFGFVDGFCNRLTAPGLGIEVDEAAVRRAAEVGHEWRGPVWHYEDGSFAEW